MSTENLPTAATSTDTFVHLRSAGVSVLVRISAEAGVQILHWAADLGQLSEPEARQLAAMKQWRDPAQSLGTASYPSVLPELAQAWAGRPGVSGYRSALPGNEQETQESPGAAWSPRWVPTAFLAANLDGSDARQPLQTLGTEHAKGAQRTVGAEPAQRTVGAERAEGPQTFTEIGAGHLLVRLEDSVAQLGLDYELEMLPSGLLRQRARLTNLGADSYTLNDLVLTYPLSPEAREILDFAGQWGRERAPQRSKFSIGTYVREGRRGRTGHDAATILHAGTPGFNFGSGELWAVHVGRSGNHTHYAERVNDGYGVLGGGELLLPGEVQLASNDSYESPWLYGCYGIGLDQIAARFHRYLRARPTHPDTRRPVTLNVWEAVYFQHDLPQLTKLAETAAALGVERFVLDDGWFSSRRNDKSGLGDWTISAEAWPDGLDPLINTVRDNGMEFGLWFEPEMINEDSDLARAHPEWILAPDRERLPRRFRHQQVLNLANPEAFEHVYSHVSAIIAHYQISYIKWDCNRDWIESGDQQHGGAPATHALTEATYRFMDQLKEQFPNLEIESCAGGGGRVDLGVLERTDRVWPSDNSDAHERQQIQRWSGQLLPPELIGAHISASPNHQTGRHSSLAFRAATAAAGHLGIEWNILEATDQERTDIASWIDFYQQHRDFLLSSDVIRLDVSDPSMHIHGRVSSDQSLALFWFVGLDAARSLPRELVRLRGLDPAKRYRAEIAGPQGNSQGDSQGNSHQKLPTWLSHPEHVIPGSALMNLGFAPPLLGVDQSVLVRFTADRGR